MHGIDISMRTLRRRLCKLSLERNNAASCSDAALAPGSSEEEDSHARG